MPLPFLLEAGAPERAECPGGSWWDWTCRFPRDSPSCVFDLLYLRRERASVGVSGMLSELRWLCLSELGKEGIHTVLLWMSYMSQLFPGVKTLDFPEVRLLLALMEIFVLLGLAKIPPRKSLLGSDVIDGPCEKEMLFFQESSLVPVLLCHCCGHCMSLCEIPEVPGLAGATWP